MPSGNSVGGAGLQSLTPTTQEVKGPKYLTISEAENGFVVMTNHTGDYEVDYHVAKDKNEIQEIIETYL